jgi:hypothetical protein
MDYIRVIKEANDVEDSINCLYVAEEGISQSLPFTCPFDKASYVSDLKVGRVR